MTLIDTVKDELADFSGQLIGPQDVSYDAARHVYNAMIDKSPTMITQVRTEADVMKVVNLARRHDLLVAVRGGGHHGAGLGTCDDGIEIDLAGLNSVEVDPERGPCNPHPVIKVSVKRGETHRRLSRR